MEKAVKNSNLYLAPFLAFLMMLACTGFTIAQEKKEEGSAKKMEGSAQKVDGSAKKMEGSTDDGWVNMFNGENLLGWHVNENHGAVYVEGNCLVTSGNRGHAFYVGPNGHTDVKNFHFKAKVKTMKNANSGICLLYTSPSPRDLSTSRMPSSA